MLTSISGKGGTALSLLLGSIVAGVTNGCASDGSDGPRGTRSEVGSDGTPGGSSVVELESEVTSSEPDGEPVEAICTEGRPSLTAGLTPAVEIDSLSHYVAVTEDVCVPPRDHELLSESGKPCESADDEAACRQEMQRLRTGSADFSHYEDFWTTSWGLLIATGSEAAVERLGGPVSELDGDSCGSGVRGSEAAMLDVSHDTGGFGGAGGAAPERSPCESRNVTKIHDRETLLRLLGDIDTPNEAALVLWAHDFSPGCEMVRKGGGYALRTNEQVNDNPVTYQGYEVHVSSQGVVTSQAVGEPWVSQGYAGRRPVGLLSAGPSEASSDRAGGALAKLARLEGAAVVAFAQLSRELERLDAPRDLVERAKEAALDEIRHARAVRALCEARGHGVDPVVVDRVGERTVLSLAVENAVEGCVRECWGALVAHYQAAHAKDPEVRGVWKTIAEEETGHAVLSADIARWLEGRLDAESLRVVASAYDQAIEDLRQEITEGTMGCDELGFPDRRTGLLLFAELESRVFPLNRPAAHA